MIHQETYCDVSGRFSVREFCIRVQQQQQQQLIMVMVEMLDFITLVVSSLCFFVWLDYSLVFL